MRTAKLLFVLALAWAPACETGHALRPQPPASASPKLIVAILIDGLGLHQVTRYWDHLGPGGFRRFLEEGAWFANANYGHSTTITAVGHGTWLTGAYPYRHGLISNEWFDRNTKKTVYCTEDPAAHYLGEPTKEHAGTSPKKLRVTTVGDELRLATNMKSRVFAVSLKDRGAILPAGHLGTPYFYSSQTGRFITSDFYMEEFPKWWSDFEHGHPQDKWFGKEWVPLLPEEAYAGTVEGQPWVVGYKGLGRKFPHKVTGSKPRPGADYYGAIEGTPFGHEYLAEFTQTLIAQENVGRNPAGVPDLLAVSFSSHDFINHVYGPESKESEDDFVRLDRVLESFFQFLDKWVGLDNVLLTLTADHGFSYSPEYWKSVLRFDADRLNSATLLKKLNDHLSATYGLGKYAMAWRFPTFWLDYGLIDSRHLSRADVERESAQFLMTQPGIQSVFTRTDLTEGRVPQTRLGQLVSRSWHPQLSGDLQVIQEDGWIFNDGILLSAAASHGTPWLYDTRVPLMFLGSRWIRPGKYPAAAEPADIAPTLAYLLTVPPPSGSEGRTLAEILK